ncbi:hypothetical protein L3X38_008111 [Prunus dulcis]|uniref:TF-B3 domain-containing protein n=1 Tax=Prunus dulcis TaxID=3755 RepID=A0AAD5F6J2_PRUDU|nr:hypothetical protein L3X38_008111 [Prunus dulcis]
MHSLPWFPDRSSWLPLMLSSIPVVFSRSLHEKNEALLKSCQGYWPIKVHKHGDGLLYFEGGGWKEFVEHHGLELGEFLVLKHQGIKLLLTMLLNFCRDSSSVASTS